MRVTAELRWFWPGTVPQPFYDWFIAAGAQWPASSKVQARTDAYLQAPSQRELGIKKRGGGGTEIKGLVCRRADRLSLSGVSCSVEVWSKWSSDSLDLHGQPFIEVRKQRWLRRFSIIDGVPLEEADSETERRTGCDVEMTMLSLADYGAWWTFGLESFGDLKSVETDLAETVASLAARHPPSLPHGLASGYPAWLSSLLKTAGQPGIPVP